MNFEILKMKQSLLRNDNRLMKKKDLLLEFIL